MTHKTCDCVNECQPKAQTKKGKLVCMDLDTFLSCRLVREGNLINGKLIKLTPANEIISCKAIKGDK